VIASVREFAEYFEGVRRRTRQFCDALPADAIDWAPKAGEYSCGDIIRHLAASERMFTGVVADGVWRYGGHEALRGATLAAAVALLDAEHAAARAALTHVADTALATERGSLEPGARPIRAWRVLMAMCEHEVHHRSQLASYLTLMGIEPPDIFGLGVEDVERLTAGAAGRTG
jgi:uncharacterized damage-inducible protein DinB